MGFDLSSSVAPLESHLATRSYVEGFEPSQADVALFNEVKTAPSSSEYPHVSKISMNKIDVFFQRRKDATNFGICF